MSLRSKSLLIVGILLVIGALAVNPVAPLLTVVPQNIIGFDTNGQTANLPAGQSAGWSIDVIKSFYATSVSFNFPATASGGGGPTASYGSVEVRKFPSATPSGLIYAAPEKQLTGGWMNWPLGGSIIMEKDFRYEFVFIATRTAVPISLATVNDNANVFGTVSQKGLVQVAFKLDGAVDVPDEQTWTLEAKFTADVDSQRTVTLTDMTVVDGVSEVSAHFDFGDGSGADAVPKTSVLHTYLADGIYTVVLKVTDDKGHTDSVSQKVTAQKGSDPPPTTVSLNAGFAWVTSGLGVSVSGNLSTADGAYITKYDWTFGDAAVGAGTWTDHKYTIAGTYTVTLKITATNGDTDTASAVITVAVGSDNGGDTSRGSTQLAGASGFITDNRLIIFSGLLIAGVILILVSRRYK